MLPSSTVYGGQHDTQYVKFELRLHAAFVADKNGFLFLNELVHTRCEFQKSFCDLLLTERSTVYMLTAI